MLKKTLQILAFASVLLAVPAFAQDVPTEQSLKDRNAVLLNNEELQSLLNNQTIYHRHFKTGQILPMYFDTQTGLRYFKISGRAMKTAWAIRDGRRCEDTMSGASVCMAIYKDGDAWTICDPRDGGECRWRITRSVAGDPDALKH
jgi:hypothetical protein